MTTYLIHVFLVCLFVVGFQHDWLRGRTGIVGVIFIHKFGGGGFHTILVMYTSEKYIPLIRNAIGTACEYLGYVRLGLRGVAWGSIGHVIFISRQQAVNTQYTGYLWLI